MTFAGNLRRLRETAKMTQAELARKAGLALPTIGRLEAGMRLDPPLSTVTKLAVALGVSLDAFTD